jgi:hypothetical protein
MNKDPYYEQDFNRIASEILSSDSHPVTEVRDVKKHPPNLNDLKRNTTNLYIVLDKNDRDVEYLRATELMLSKSAKTLDFIKIWPSKHPNGFYISRHL